MKLLTIDFETVDPYIDRGLGVGWVFGKNIQGSDFKTIGYSVALIDTETKLIEKPVYFSISKEDLYSIEDLNRTIDRSDGIICHNATYDLGCLEYLGINTKNIVCFDTKLMAILYNNETESIIEKVRPFSLENLAALYLKEDSQKGTNSLIDFAIDNKLVLEPKRKNYNIKKFRKKVKDWCYANMDVIQSMNFNVMSDYCNLDVLATSNLFLYFLDKGISIENARYWSFFQNIVVKLRNKGCKIDMEKLNEGINIVTPEVEKLSTILLSKFPLGTTIEDLDSTKKLGKLLKQLNYILPKTIKGNDSTNAKWIKENDSDPLLKLLGEYRTTKKILNDFFIKIKNMQQYSCPEAYHGSRYGRIFPELNIFGADATGRMSSSCPNEQQIPKRHERYGKLIRSIFIPENESNKVFALDYSNQEGRIQVHYCYKIGAKGSGSIVKKWNENPYMDQHRLTYSNMFNVSYESVTDNQKSFIKPLNLGLSYGMQSGSLAKAIKLPTKLITSSKGYKYAVAGEEAEKILNLHKKMQPYVYQLIDKCKKVIVKQGYITTIAGRKLYKDKYKDYTGISKKIQGSGADFIYESLRQAYAAGIDIMLLIHDEVVIEGTLDNARKMAYIMENAYKLVVPMVVEIKRGNNWGEISKINLNEIEVKQ